MSFTVRCMARGCTWMERNTNTIPYYCPKCARCKVEVDINDYFKARDYFLHLLHRREIAHYTAHYANLTPGTFTVMPGRKYDKIVHVSSGSSGCSRSSYCYIDRANGNILKGNWKGVTLPKVARGNIFNSDPLAGTNEYGVNYLR